MRRRKIWFGTGNPDKVREASVILDKYGVEVAHHDIDKLEIQADTLEEVSKHSLDALKTEKPVAVEDSGLFIEWYKGFPGPYSHYVLDTLGLEGVLKLMKGIDDRQACFRSVVAYRENTITKVFSGTVEGVISEEIKGSYGFGYDPIFIPDEVPGDETFGELPTETKNSLSHRARSFMALGEWLKER
ncbi:MAG: XTP/dITP diphosphatase [Candidatus Bathyarchaeia archaeon]